jgi:6-hydroxytryprostatin B O-methyltransferase
MSDNCVQVGGSAGSVSIALAKAFPELNFIVQDLPGNVNSGNAFSGDELSLAGRIVFQAHNFFDIQPYKGADVYLLRMIIHDWQTEDAAKILRQLISAMKTNSRIIIMDTLLPTPGTMPAIQESLLRAREMTMLQSFNSTERDIDDWKVLLQTTDPRFKIANVVQPVGSIMAVLEVTLDSE